MVSHLPPTPESTFSANLSDLLRTVPDRRTPAIERAAWFDRKADLLDHAGAPDLAESARLEAAWIRRTVSDQSDAFPQGSPLVDPGTMIGAEVRR